MHKGRYVIMVRPSYAGIAHIYDWCSSDVTEEEAKRIIRTLRMTQPHLGRFSLHLVLIEEDEDV